MAERTKRIMGNPEARFLLRVDKNGAGGCWLWTGYVAKTGYARLSVDGNYVYAHRWSYEHHVGPIPAGLVIDHLCSVRHCVNPDHLEPVTDAENVRRGEGGAHWSAKTHCPRGHAYDEANTYTNPQGRRNCRACARKPRKRAR